jgi:hypothetical protein
MADLLPGSIGGPGLPDRVRIAESTIQTNAIVEQDRWGRFIKEAERSGDRLMEELTERMADRAKRYAPNRTGRLRNSIEPWVSPNGREGRVFSDVPYAGVMESGSKPHLIHGVRANFNWAGGRFVWNDKRYGPIGEDFRDYDRSGGTEARRRNHHYRRRHKRYENWTYEHGATVRHPGTKPHMFFARAFHETWAEARFIMRKTYS